MHKKIARWFTIFSIMLCILVVFQSICYSQKERQLMIGTVGSLKNKGPQYNPFVVCRPKEVQLLLLEIAESPMKREEIESRLSSSRTKIEDLLRLEIIRQEEELFYINFSLFTEKDQAIINKVAAEKYSKLLAENILKKKKQIYDLLNKYQPSSIGKDKLAFIAVGGLSLDLGALDLLAENNYINTGAEAEKPGGNYYFLTAYEVTKFSLKEIYRGSHSEGVDNILFITFGDHNTRQKRYAFPDIIWRLDLRSSLKIPEFYKSELINLLNDQVENMAEKAAKVLFILKESSLPFDRIQESSSIADEELKHLLDFLIKINYITLKDSQYSLIIPVFSQADEKILRDIQSIVNQEILSWAESYYEQIKVDLKDISALKNKVSFKEAFYMLWHYFFGHTNKILAHSGFIYDTYQSPEGQKGYLPTVIKRD